jgi:hypothetical protein
MLYRKGFQVAADHDPVHAQDSDRLAQVLRRGAGHVEIDVGVALATTLHASKEARIDLPIFVSTIGTSGNAPVSSSTHTGS